MIDFIHNEPRSELPSVQLTRAAVYFNNNHSPFNTFLRFLFISATMSSFLELEFKDLNISSADAVVVVDTFSTGALISSKLHKKGVKVVCVLSGDLKGLLDLIPAGLDLEFAATIVYNTENGPDGLSEVLSELNALPFKISAVIAGAETGVELADRLSESLGLRTNGTNHSEARRNKFVMGETIRAAGIRAVHQVLAGTAAVPHSHLGHSRHIFVITI